MDATAIRQPSPHRTVCEKMVPPVNTSSLTSPTLETPRNEHPLAEGRL